MANVYVRSGAAGAGTGADWTNAYTTLVAALAAKAAGDSFWVSEDHAETAASTKQLLSPGTAANPCFIYCVDHAGTVPPVSADLRTTGSIATTGNFNLQLYGYAYYYGLTFSCGNSTSVPTLEVAASADDWIRLDSCKLVLGATGSTSNITFGGSSGGCHYKAELVNTTLTFGAVGQAARLNDINLIWRNTASALAGATIPTSLFTYAVAKAGRVYCDGVDFSAAGSGKTLVGAIPAPFIITLKDCKFNASVTVAATPTAPGGAEIHVIRSDSSGTNYRAEKYSYMGTQTVETTIVRTGGASDGTTTIANKIVTTANSKWVLPFEATPIAIWNDSTSAITTLTIYGTTTGGGVPKDDEIWVDVEYLGSGSTPQGSFITSSKADNLAASAATNNSSDASTWGGSGAGNGFKIVVPTFTPGMKGPITITVNAAKASATYYIDPKPSISNVTVTKSEILAPGVYVNELSSGGGISRARAASGF